MPKIKWKVGMKFTADYVPAGHEDISKPVKVTAEIYAKDTKYDMGWLWQIVKPRSIAKCADTGSGFNFTEFKNIEVINANNK